MIHVSKGRRGASARDDEKTLSFARKRRKIAQKQTRRSPPRESKKGRNGFRKYGRRDVICGARSTQSA